VTARIVTGPQPRNRRHRWLLVPFDFGEEFAQFTDHDVVDQIDRWVVEGHSP